ncbi:RNA polymerase II transcription factor SIII (Elongin) subunit A [Apiospora phragmitis]|uniref:RNA polymerase II transcription factor SIII (Elongin) subunit A n=1 Tax=Apiospora phragmitis TaxID=2905665 RepID=A0ABR1TVQ7_9PEZI
MFETIQNCRGDSHAHGAVTSANKTQDIRDIGSAHYDLIRPILLRIDSASQLRAIEEASPHLEEHNEEVWLRLIKREFPTLHEKENLKPSRPQLWHRVYAKYSRIDTKNKAEAAEKLRNAFAGINAKKQANTSSIVTFDRRKLPQPPKDSRFTGDKKGATGRRGGSNDTGELRFTSGTRTKVSTAQSLMRKVKREAKEIHNRNKIATPTNALRVNKGQIKHAPQGMVNEQRIKAQPSLKIQPPTLKRNFPDRDFGGKSLEEAEARLRSIKSGKQPTIVSDSDLDENDDDDVFGDGGGGGGLLGEDDLEAIFDEPSKPERSSRPAPQASRPLLPGKRSGVLSNVRRVESQVRQAPASKREASSPPSSPPMKAEAASPPLKSSMPPRKRKPVGVFMQPKAKARRPN